MGFLDELNDNAKTLDEINNDSLTLKQNTEKQLFENIGTYCERIGKVVIPKIKSCSLSAVEKGWFKSNPNTLYGIISLSYDEDHDKEIYCSMRIGLKDRKLLSFQQCKGAWEGERLVITDIYGNYNSYEELCIIKHFFLGKEFITYFSKYLERQIEGFKPLKIYDFGSQHQGIFNIFF